MPTLIPLLHFDEIEKTGKLGQPILWQCSDCDSLFSLERIMPKATAGQLRRVDSRFRIHCKHDHPNKAVIGLDLPVEDFSQAAARIVRDATGKS